MKVFDCLNERYYEKKDLIKESFDIFFKDGKRWTGLKGKELKMWAFDWAEEYVKENTILPSQVKQWRKENE